MTTQPYLSPFIIVAFISAAVLNAAETPAELTVIRGTYETALASATKPVRDKYIGELQQLRIRAMSSNNLDLAVVIDQELKSLGATQPVLGAVFRDRLVNTTWTWFKEERITLLPNGKAQWSFNGKEAFTWRVVSDSDRIIAGTTPKGGGYRITFAAGLTTGKLNDGSAERETHLIPNTK